MAKFEVEVTGEGHELVFCPTYDLQGRISWEDGECVLEDVDTGAVFRASSRGSACLEWVADWGRQPLVWEVVVCEDSV